MKVLCVLLPHFLLKCEVERQPALAGHPSLVIETAGSKRLVLDFSPELTGLQAGMTVQQAISRHGEVELIPADKEHYRSTFSSILDALETKSPLVEGSDLGCAYIGLDGLQPLYGSDENMVCTVREVIPETFAPCFGLAEGKFLAYLAAMNSPSGEWRVLIDNIGPFLKDLPCDVLPVSVNSRQKLHEFGLHTLGQVATLPPGPLLSQFGPEGKRIWELASGHDDTPLYPRSWQETIVESTTLPSITVSLDSILVAVESLLIRAFARDLNGRGIRSLTLWAKTWPSGHWEKSIQFKEPAMSTKKALSRIKHLVEQSPPPGPVEELGLKLTGLGISSGRQNNLLTDIRARDHLLDDIRQLEFRLGGPQVFKIKELEPWSRIPERRRVLAPISQ